jgi:putative glutamine amidotransferase
LETEYHLVAIPARLLDGPGTDPRVVAANRLFHDLVDLLKLNRLVPVIVTDPQADLSAYAGLVLPGGGDIDPARYGGSRVEAIYDVNVDQDELDFQLTESALRLGIPVLGICRGAQVINVALGGTLIEDLPQSSVQHCHIPGEGDEPDLVWHEVSLGGGTRLLAQTGKSRLNVASGHHQGISVLGAGLQASAIAEDGLIEAFEDVAGRVFGVQWHPEAFGMEPNLRDAHFRILAAAITYQATKRPILEWDHI